MKEPKLRFKADDGSDFPDWEEKRLGDIANRVTRKNKRNISDIPLTISSVDGLIDQRNFFNKVVASRDMSGYYLLKNGEFAYNKSYSKGYDFGSIKRLDLYNQGALSTLYICFALNENENSDFYQKYFDSLSWYPELQKICAEGARNHGLLNVPTNDFFQIKLRVPKVKDEQQKIADFLSTIDTIIEKQRVTVSAWEERKKGVMQKLFSQEVRFKADDGSDFPDWEEKKVASLGDMVGGGTPTTKKKEYWHGRTAWISSADVEENDIYNINMTRFITQEAIDNSATKIIPKNSILIVSRVGVGKVAKAPCDLCTSQDFTNIVDVKGDSTFLTYAVLRLMQSKLQCVQGTSIKGIPSDEIRNYIMNVPSLPEQQKIADCLSALDAVIEKQKETLEKWQELKKGLLQQMFV